MFNHRKIFVLGIITLFLLAATFIATANPETGKDKELLKVANPMMDNILKGIREKSYEVYIRDFDEKTRAGITVKKFNDLVKNLEHYHGEYKSREFIEILTKNDLKKVIWKAEFSKVANGISLELVLAKQNNEWKVAGLWFHPWKK